MGKGYMQARMVKAEQPKEKKKKFRIRNYAKALAMSNGETPSNNVFKTTQGRTTTGRKGKKYNR